MSELSGEAAPRVIQTWQQFRLHALDCQDCCERVVRIVHRGGHVEFAEVHWQTCDIGRPLLEAWRHAVETRLEVVRRNAGIRRLPA